MPQETDRLQLPLPLGNETVTRESINGIFEKIDAGVATQADLDALRETVSKMDIPDASLTQKGKVQLSNKTDGTSELVAATEKAVRDASRATVNAAATDATSKANAAELNTKNYADANFCKPSEVMSSNLIKNSSGMLNLDYWKNSGQATFLRFQNQTVGAFFAVNSSVSPTNYGVLDNEPVGVSPGGRYLLQAVFHTRETYYNSAVLIEVKNASDNVTINSLVADNQKWWHRKAQVITIPTGVTAIYLRLVVNNVPVGTHGFARIKLSEVMDDAGKDMPYSVEMDTRALYEGIDSVKQSGVDAKQGIVNAINAKGVNASISDTWVTLTTKLGQIQQGHYRRLLPNINYRAEHGRNDNKPPVTYIDIADFPAGTKVIQLTRNYTDFGSPGIQVSHGSGATAYDKPLIVLEDQWGLEWIINYQVNGSNATRFDSFSALNIDLVANVALVTLSTTENLSLNLRPGFDVTGPLKLRFKLIKIDGFLTFTAIFNNGSSIISI
ncbi:tail fiber protein [Paenibacillus xylanexedens]|uniref:tail fiber protein n=1 Tax=Paenibacillus xylanexedens TaxID=528191 RepID=UPI001C9308CA|nr:phage tail protein [Paenibacillus xylanexedens]